MTTRNIKIFNANRAFGDATSNTPILEAGSLTWDLSNGLRLHDGTTAGGNQIATGGGGFATTSTLINGAYAVSLDTNGTLTAGTIEVVGEGTGITVDASAGMNRTGFMKYYGIEGAFVHGSTNPLRFGRVSVPDITTATYNIFTTEIFISTAGLVGINTTTPGERFDVNGNIQTNGSLKFSADGSIQTTAWTGSTSTLISSDGSSVASLTVLYNGANSAPELRPGGHYDLGSGSYKLRDVWADGSIGPANSLTFANNSQLAQSGNDMNFGVNGAVSWHFSNTGTLTTPGPIEVQGAGSDITGVGTIEGIGDSVILEATDGTNTSTWTFSSTGTIAFPDSTVQTTAWTGTNTLVTQAVSATTATNAGYAYSFNTGTLVTNAVTVNTVGSLNTNAVFYPLVGGNSGGQQTPSTIASFNVNASSGLLTVSGINLGYAGSTLQINGATAMSATGLGSGITATSITSVGTLTSLTVGGLIYGTASAGTTATTSAAVGYLGMPQTSTATSYTVQASDQGKHIYITATGQTMTIPANTVTSLPVGSTIAFIASSVATTSTIACPDTMYLAGTGSTGTRTLAAYGMATAVKVAATTWFINGNGLT